MSHPDTPRATRVLLVDDEESLLRAYSRVLTAAGFAVSKALSAPEALALLDGGDIDVIVSDIQMPGMDGVNLLRAVRDRDLDLPVILITGRPDIDSAATAVELGALRYLVKPVDHATLIDVVDRAAKLQGLARLKRDVAALNGLEAGLSTDRAGLEGALCRGLETLWMAFQPVIDPHRRQIVAFEALARTRDSRIPHPGVLFSTAEHLGRVRDVGRAVRTSVAQTIAQQGVTHDIYVNLHPDELLDDDLFSPSSPLSHHAPQVVLEITERAALEVGADIPGRIARLRTLGYRIAIDDLGAGYAGLNYFALLTPDVVKLDMSLIRDLDSLAIKRKLVGSIAGLCQDLAMTVVAEGIETDGERDAAIALGCDLLQGFRFARPGPAWPTVAW